MSNKPFFYIAIFADSPSSDQLNNSNFNKRSKVSQESPMFNASPIQLGKHYSSSQKSTREVHPETQMLIQHLIKDTALNPITHSSSDRIFFNTWQSKF